ncbi:MAG: branched-chain amino acid ABC transporter permease [Methyloligellaceae bacterium]
MYELAIFSVINGFEYGLRLFLLASGLTLIFSMMGVLNFAHASFYMLGAYIAFTIAQFFSANNIGLFGYEISGFWIALFVAPILVGILGGLIQRYLLSRVHKFGHVPELIFTFSLAFLIEEVVKFIWGGDLKAGNELKPDVLDGTAFIVANSHVPAYKVFMICVSIVIFLALLYLLLRTRVGLIIQASITHPNVVGMLGHNVPFIFMAVFSVGTMLAGVAGVIAGPEQSISPAMGFELGSIIFVVIVVGGLGSLAGGFISALAIGLIVTAAKTFDGSIAHIISYTTDSLFAFKFAPDGFLFQALGVPFPQVAPLIPYLLLVLILIFRPMGLMGNREV